MLTEVDVYQFYTDKIKVLYSEIEARNNSIPVELLFEIFSAFDHLKRIHIDNENTGKACERAFSHLKRGALDAFKLKLKYHNTDYNKLTRSRSDLNLIDNGNFFPDMLSSRKKILNTAKDARSSEGSSNIDAAFEKWSETSLLIDAFEDKYFDNTKLSWAKKNTYIRFGWNSIIGFMIGVISSSFVTYLFGYFS